MEAVRFGVVERAVGAFQESLTAEQIMVLGRRAFGVDVVSAVELGSGAYNNTYRVDIGSEKPVILRVGPTEERQFRIEFRLLRNEYLSMPFFAPLADMMPWTLFADWSHELIGRDYVWQTMLEGVSGGDGLHNYPRPEWGHFYRQVGTIARRIHAISGERFGMVGGPLFDTWGDAVLACLHDTVADLVDAGLDADDFAALIDIVERDRSVLDAITEPRLLHGDLWVPNIMFASGAPLPTVTGFFDQDRASWGDPAADWCNYVAGQRDRGAFFETYGTPDDSPDAIWRSHVYEARHIGAVRLERHRRGTVDRIPATYDDMRRVLAALRR